tara:strand:+ start:331 stop:912 length:582 start_codon:yes stop_codon:yes gene_type:complete
MTQTKIKVRSGNATVEMDAAATKIFTEIIKHAAPQTIRVLTDVVEEIYDDAHRVWPVRQPKSVKDLTEEGKVRVTANNIAKTDGDYNRKRAFAAAYHMQDLGILKVPEYKVTSKGSKNKLYTELTIQGDDIFAKVGNSAPYAWAIKVGENTDLPYALGARVSNELLWKPAKRKTDRVVEILADELADDIKRAK